MQENENEVNLDLSSQYLPPNAATLADRLSYSSSNKRGEVLKGCDFIHELSITIRCCAKTSIPNDRLVTLVFVLFLN